MMRASTILLRSADKLADRLVHIGSGDDRELKVF